MQPDYEPGLATLELIVEVRRLLATERRTERLICRYLADLADRVREGLDHALWGYADELHAARCIFGLGVRDTRERVRVGRALRELPRVEAAFVSGRRVAAERSGAASQVSAHAQQATSTTDKPVRTEWLTQNTVRVTFELSAEAWGLLERALEGARRCGDTKHCADTKRADDASAEATGGGTTDDDDTMGGRTMSDADALAAVARDALSAQHQDADASDPRCAVVVYECESCGKSEVDTGIGPLELEPANAAALCCGRSEVQLEAEGCIVKRGGPLPAACAAR